MNDALEPARGVTKMDVQPISGAGKASEPAAPAPGTSSADGLPKPDPQKSGAFDASSPPLLSGKNLLRIAGLGTVIPAFITAGVSFATMITTYATEQMKVQAHREDREHQDIAAQAARQAKLQDDQRERESVGQQKLRDLQTKYVDLGLDRQLCLDYRVRIFGYLSAVLKNDEKAWATTQLQQAQADLQKINDLKKAIADAKLNLVSPTKIGFEKFKLSGAFVEGTDKVLDAYREYLRQSIDSYESNLRDAELNDPPCQEPPAEAGNETQGRRPASPVRH
tara:strand:+ start:5901 stop:6740 length:840 start_codon:yes stop_codon:yes gene_type:complete